MRPPIGLPAQPGLAHQHEGSQEDRLEGDDECQKSERKWIDRLDARDGFSVQQYPCSEKQGMKQDECRASGEVRNGIADALPVSAMLHRSLLESRNRVDVVWGG